MGTNKAAGEKTEDWKKQASGDERKMKWNRKLKMGIKNGSNGARTHDLSRVRRTLIPAELCFHNYAMRITGLEPARLLTIEPKSIASATSAISAY